MEAYINYWVSYGKGDGSETLDTYVELSGEEEKTYTDAIADGRDLNTVAELEGVLARARDEIEELELDNAIDMEEFFAMECAGLYPVDGDDINELVEKRDPHTLKFFGLDKMTDEELNDWDAWDIDMLPLRKDFEPDFEPCSPFDSGWTLEVEFAEPGSAEIEDAVSDRLRRLFSAADGDYSSVTDYVYELYARSVKYSCGCDFFRLAEELAAELGIEGFSFDEEEDG